MHDSSFQRAGLPIKSGQDGNPGNGTSGVGKQITGNMWKVFIGLVGILMLWAGNGWAQGGTPPASGEGKAVPASAIDGNPPVGYWRFDGDLSDASGRGNDAKGDAGFADGKVGRALQVQGQRVQIPASPEMGLAPGFAIDCYDATFSVCVGNCGGQLVCRLLAWITLRNFFILW